MNNVKNVICFTDQPVSSSSSSQGSTLSTVQFAFFGFILYICVYHVLQHFTSFHVYVLLVLLFFITYAIFYLHIDYFFLLNVHCPLCASLWCVVAAVREATVAWRQWVSLRTNCQEESLDERKPPAYKHVKACKIIQTVYCNSFLFQKLKTKASDSYITRLTGRNLTSRALQSSEVAVDRQESMVLQR